MARVTIELDADVAERLERESKRVGRTTEEIVNSTMREQLPDREFYARDLNVRPGVNFDRAWELLAEEDEERIRGTK